MRVLLDRRFASWAGPRRFTSAWPARRSSRRASTASTCRGSASCSPRRSWRRALLDRRDVRRDGRASWAPIRCATCRSSRSPAPSASRPSQLCQACITGDYPTPCGQKLYQIALDNYEREADGGAERTYEAARRRSGRRLGQSAAAASTDRSRRPRRPPARASMRYASRTPPDTPARRAAACGVRSACGSRDRARPAAPAPAAGPRAASSRRSAPACASKYSFTSVQKCSRPPGCSVRTTSARNASFITRRLWWRAFHHGSGK